MSDPALHVEFDLPCARCGYNLRSLSRRGACPECGHPVWRSLMGDDLAQADPGWLGLQRVGLLLAIACVALYIAQDYMFRRRYGFTAFEQWKIVPTVLVPCAAMLCGAAATWLLTIPEPRRARRSFWRDLGILTRIAMLGHIAAELTYFSITISPFADTQDGVLWSLFAEGIASRFLAILHGVGVYLIVARLARRIPSRILAWGMIALIVITSLSNLGFMYIASVRIDNLLNGSWNDNYAAAWQLTRKLWWGGAWLEIILAIALLIAIGSAMHKGRQAIAPPSVTEAGEV